MADFGIQEPQIVDRFGCSTDGGAAGARDITAGYRDRSREAVDAVGLRLVEPFEKLPRVKRKALDVSPLTFGVERIEGETCLAATADTANDHQLVLRNIEVDVLEVVDGHASQFDIPHTHDPTSPDQIL